MLCYPPLAWMSVVEKRDGKPDEKSEAWATKVGSAPLIPGYGSQSAASGSHLGRSRQMLLPPLQTCFRHSNFIL